MSSWTTHDEEDHVECVLTDLFAKILFANSLIANYSAFKTGK